MQARGLFALSCFFLTASLAAAGQQFKFVDLDPWHVPGVSTPNNIIQIEKINSDGSMVFGGNYGPSNNRGYASATRLANGHVSWIPDQRFGFGLNTKGDVTVNGGVSLNGYYDFNTGGTVRYADGSEYVIPPFNGKTFACARDINDSGIVVGHYSTYTISNYVSFDYGKPFYMKNGVVMMPFGDTFQGTFCSVDKYGRAFLDSGGYWSPEDGYVPSSILNGGGYAQRTDSNDKLEVIGYDSDPSTGLSVTAIRSMNSKRLLPLPSFYPGDANDFDPGGLNNNGQVVSAYYRRIVNNKLQWQWCYWDGSTWTDLYAALQGQVPTGWTFDRVKDIDDFGRIYGTMKKPDGSMTIVRLDPVPEPATLATLALGALLLRRKRSASTRAA